MPRKKKSTSTPLQGIDWDSEEYKGEHPIGIAPGDWGKVKIGPPKEKPYSTTHIYGYHSTYSEPDSVLKTGLKANNPLADAGFDEPISEEEHRAATGVYFHGVPHIEYGPNMYRIKVSRDEPISGEFDRPGEGENTLGDVPAKNVKYLGHGMEYNLSDFHATSLPSEKCPACIIAGLHHEEMAKRRLGPQFNGENNA